MSLKGLKGRVVKGLQAEIEQCAGHDRHSEACNCGHTARNVAQAIRTYLAEDIREWLEPKCARCGELAVGFAEIDGDRYCHGEDDRPSCYELSSWETRR